MSRKNALFVVLAFVLAATTVLVAKTKLVFDPNAYYAGKDSKTASASLLAEAEKLAGQDTWQRIGVGRVAYAIGKNWGKAKPLFERAIALDAGDDTGIMKAACWFNLNGERERAEQLFGLAFSKNPDAVWHYTLAAGSYVGVQPF